MFQHSYNLHGIDIHKEFLFRRAIEKVEWNISGFIREYKTHCNNLKDKGFKIFYGFDDANGYVFPILYACRQNNIKTIGHQHGLYSKRHAGYIMEGIDPKDYVWFDKIIVWGDYWKDHILSISNVYSPDMFIVGANKLSWNYTLPKTSKSRPKNILVPYEFATNTYKVGRFMMKFIDLGYNVYFKPREDERLEDQLEAYRLPDEYRHRVSIITDIDNSTMEMIDIIVGTMTVLIYELLPFKKIIWVLDIEFNLIDDLVEDGYAHKIKYEDLDKLDESYFVRTEEDANYFFSSETLKETLSKHTFEPLNNK
jgi:hypothetical protein